MNAITKDFQKKKHNFHSLKRLPKTCQNCEYLFRYLTIYFPVKFIFGILKN